MIQVWEERRVFGGSGVKPFMDAVNGLAKPGAWFIFMKQAKTCNIMSPGPPKRPARRPTTPLLFALASLYPSLHLMFICLFFKLCHKALDFCKIWSGPQKRTVP